MRKSWYVKPIKPRHRCLERDGLLSLVSLFPHRLGFELLPHPLPRGAHVPRVQRPPPCLPHCPLSLCHFSGSFLLVFTLLPPSSEEARPMRLLYSWEEPTFWIPNVKAICLCLFVCFFGRGNPACCDSCGANPRL